MKSACDTRRTCAPPYPPSQAQKQAKAEEAARKKAEKDAKKLAKKTAKKQQRPQQTGKAKTEKEPTAAEFKVRLLIIFFDKRAR